MKVNKTIKQLPISLDTIFSGTNEAMNQNRFHGEISIQSPINGELVPLGQLVSAGTNSLSPKYRTIDGQSISCSASLQLSPLNACIGNDIPGKSGFTYLPGMESLSPHSNIKDMIAQTASYSNCVISNKYPKVPNRTPSQALEGVMYRMAKSVGFISDEPTFENDGVSRMISCQQTKAGQCGTHDAGIEISSTVLGAFDYTMALSPGLIPPSETVKNYIFNPILRCSKGHNTRFVFDIKMEARRMTKDKHTTLRLLQQIQKHCCVEGETLVLELEIEDVSDIMNGSTNLLNIRRVNGRIITDPMPNEEKNNKTQSLSIFRMSISKKSGALLSPIVTMQKYCKSGKKDKYEDIFFQELTLKYDFKRMQEAIEAGRQAMASSRHSKIIEEDATIPYMDGMIVNVIDNLVEPPEGCHTYSDFVAAANETRASGPEIATLMTMEAYKLDSCFSLYSGTEGTTAIHRTNHAMHFVSAMFLQILTCNDGSIYLDYEQDVTKMVQFIHPKTALHRGNEDFTKSLVKAIHSAVIKKFVNKDSYRIISPSYMPAGTITFFDTKKKDVVHVVYNVLIKSDKYVWLMFDDKGLVECQTFDEEKQMMAQILKMSECYMIKVFCTPVIERLMHTKKLSKKVSYELQYSSLRYGDFHRLVEGDFVGLKSKSAIHTALWSGKNRQKKDRIEAKDIKRVSRLLEDSNIQYATRSVWKESLVRIETIARRRIHNRKDLLIAINETKSCRSETLSNKMLVVPKLEHVVRYSMYQTMFTPPCPVYDLYYSEGYYNYAMNIGTWFVKGTFTMPTSTPSNDVEPPIDRVWTHLILTDEIKTSINSHLDDAQILTLIKVMETWLPTSTYKKIAGELKCEDDSKPGLQVVKAYDSESGTQHLSFPISVPPAHRLSYNLMLLDRGATVEKLQEGVYTKNTDIYTEPCAFMFTLLKIGKNNVSQFGIVNITPAISFIKSVCSARLIQNASKISMSSSEDGQLIVLR